MNSLGDLISGLELIGDFITEAEEKAILDEVPFSQETLAVCRNSVRRYGPQRAYAGNIVSRELPKSIKALCPKLGLPYVPTSITVNEYYAGQSLGLHIDEKLCGPIISVLSLVSEATMRFEKDGISHYIKLPARSLIHMRGDSRYKWKHGVEPLKAARMSIVFRK